ncbi:Zinc finger, PMZ-type [Sesbania bispinosa]|nr:Zinc finger, PMZ-type [Sesbania bispinosa]
MRVQSEEEYDDYDDEEEKEEEDEEEEEEEEEEEGDNVYVHGDESEDDEDNEHSGDEGSIHFGDEDDARQSEYAGVGMSINDLEDMKKIDMKTISCEEITKCDFAELELGYVFYCKYAIKKGFAVRKGKVVKNTTGEIVQRTLFCNREGKRQRNNQKKREPRPETRCGCHALLTLRIDFITGRWFVKDLNDDHNHDMLEEKYYRMMAANRKMTESDLMEMNSMRSVGISVPDIYASFARRCGGYDKFIKSRYNLTEFVQHFQRCLCYVRYKEEEDDFACILGEAVLRTNFQPLERSASRHFTRNIFFIFRKVLFSAAQNFVVGCRESEMWNIYTIRRYQSGGKEWFVSLYPPTEEFKCSCQRMESYGLPCPHIVRVLVYLDYGELPQSLILERWTKRAKDSIRKMFISSSHYWDSPLIACYAAMLEQCIELCNLAARYDEEFTRIREWITSEIQCLKEKYGENVLQQLDDGVEMDGRRKNKCSQCGGIGHNKKCCPQVCAPRGAGSTFAASGHEAGSQPNFGLFVDLQLGSPITQQTQHTSEGMEHGHEERA